MAALLAIAALLIQALLPAAAMAAQARPGGATLVICTQMGPQTVKVGDAGKPHKGGFAGLPCPDCLVAASAALPAPEPLLLPISYAVAHVEHVAVRRTAPQLARAPPRPPSQGPPTA